MHFFLFFIIKGVNDFARNMNISKASLYRLLDAMKELGVPIEYGIVKQSLFMPTRLTSYVAFTLEN
ncbi:MAG: hypothetical protein A2W90_14100 [Bacteroidetes bacterium GWF2_42_66]|nr:MAG: hypothetical protein A2W92_02505 [Bacteroidetes bacterium GWA2_42_15]OFX96643.1 MAG: hypothetical protein A2W89_02410 [Bacteroidetes bacterium GWE2_42_39]OFY45350.1 MAG: hypothetical protein A2W90_14100 [Bacteroidetes bacterium GWF2_42_66]HAZ02365.1 hypothetical protein [Marinilabiliales bacterium]HBL76435.1 hypothetical protein [Prolixibacteraceae bacterium]